MDLKERKEVFVGMFGERKWKGGNDVQRLLSQNKQTTITKTLSLLNQDLHLRELYCPEVLYAPDRGKKVSKFSDDTDLCEF